jgi:speckle-type POZ protein
VVDEDSDEDSDTNMTPEQMALFVRKFNKMFKKSGFFNKNKDKDKIKMKRTSKRPCFGCGKEGHFTVECPNIRVRRRHTNKTNKNKKKEVGEAHLGEEWDSNDDSSDSDVEGGPATLSIGEPINKSSLFEDLTDDEDDFTHTCLMARGSKVDTPTPPLDDDSESDFDFEKMITSFGKKATKKIMFLMKEIRNREGTLEVQEELFRLEREKTITLENALVIEKKGFKVQEDLLKEKEIKILSLKKSLAKDELIVDELTRESFLAKDACKKLEGEKLEL